MSGDKPRVLSLVTTVRVAGTEKFVAVDAFGSNNPAGIKFSLGGNFRKNFIGKIEENIAPAIITVQRLDKPSRDPEIMAELGPEKRAIKLTHFYELIKAQANGQEGPLLINNCANIAYIEYIEDEPNYLWAVNARRNSGRREWHLDAYPVGRPYEWLAGRRVFSYKWLLAGS